MRMKLQYLRGFLIITFLYLPFRALLSWSPAKGLRPLTTLLFASLIPIIGLLQRQNWVFYYIYAITLVGLIAAYFIEIIGSHVSPTTTRDMIPAFAYLGITLILTLFLHIGSWKQKGA